MEQTEAGSGVLSTLLVFALTQSPRDQCLPLYCFCQTHGPSLPLTWLKGHLLKTFQNLPFPGLMTPSPLTAWPLDEYVLQGMALSCAVKSYLACTL